jgi:hypothetical protein
MRDVQLIIVRIIAILIGLILVLVALSSAIKTFVLPRSAPDQISRVVFLTVRRILFLRLKRARTYSERDRVMALYAPISLLALVPTWLALVMVGYAAMFWAFNGGTWYEALRTSGSFLLTLGFTTADDLTGIFLAFTETVIGLILVALLIAYLPTMYAAFSRRETAVTLLEVRAGNPPSAIEMILRFNRIHGLEQLSEQWRSWEAWFADIGESHTSLGALAFFRSPKPEHSWVTAAGAILDAAALTRSTIDIPADPQADLCIRAGYLALQRISDFFGIPYPLEPHYPEQSISVTREEFVAAYNRLAENGVPLKPDCDQAWNDFAGWRVNYDVVLRALAGLVLAPEAPWSSDRAIYGRQSIWLSSKRYGAEVPAPENLSVVENNNH